MVTTRFNFLSTAIQRRRKNFFYSTCNGRFT